MQRLTQIVVCGRQELALGPVAGFSLLPGLPRDLGLIAQLHHQLLVGDPRFGDFDPDAGDGRAIHV